MALLMKIALVSAAVFFQLGHGLDNGLALTPPMGWMTWQRFRCNTDCDNDPDNCISERLIEEQALEMVRQGFLKAGYNYIIVDDCWLERNRDPTSGQLLADSKRFPSGIKQLAEWVHQQGLYFGIYEDYGSVTCEGYPGILGHLEEDAKTLAAMDIDYIKIDGCNSDPKDMDKGYPDFGKYLNESGRPIVYSCSWPFYQLLIGMKPDYQSIVQHCNLWRLYDDIQDSYNSVLSIIDWFIGHQDEIAELAGPGHWNDPDMLLIGNFGLSLDQSRTQMAVWSVLAAPLIMSTDLRVLHADFRNLLLNPHAIRVNQDPMGIQGRHVLKIQNIDIFMRPVMPVTADGAWKSGAVAIMNRGTAGTPTKVSFTPGQLNLKSPNGYSFWEVFENRMISESVSPDTQLSIMVNPSGVQFLMFKVLEKPASV